MSRSFALFVSLGVAVFSCALVCAQVPSLPQKCAEGYIHLSPSELDEIAKLYFSGNAKELQEKLYALLETFPAGDTFLMSESEIKWNCGKYWNYRAEPVSVVLITDLRSDKGELLRFLLNDPYRNVLQGESGFWEIFLARSTDAKLASTYLSTRKPNPIAQKLAAFVKEFELESLAGIAAVGVEALGLKDFVAVQVSYVELPFKRGVVVIKDTATAPSAIPTLLTGESDLESRAKELSKKLSLRQGGISACAQQMTATLSLKIGSVLDILKKQTTKPQEQWETLEFTVRSEADTVMKSAASCTGGSLADQDIQLRAVLEVEEQFVALVAQPKKTKVEASVSYENVPLEWLGLVVMGGVITNDGDSDRVKMDGENVVADPLEGEVLAALAVNLHPLKYDPKAPKMTLKERFCFFAGASFTPEFGLVGGLGLGIVRGLSINAGVGVMWMDGLRDGDVIGQAPSNPSDPFVNERARIYFAALGFNF